MACEVLLDRRSRILGERAGVVDEFVPLRGHVIVQGVLSSAFGVVRFGAPRPWCGAGVRWSPRSQVGSVLIVAGDAPNAEDAALQ